MNVVVTPRLGKILKERGMTQKELEALSGIPQVTISAFDKRKQHSDANLFALKAALGLASVDELFEVTIKDEEDDVK